MMRWTGVIAALLLGLTRCGSPPTQVFDLSSATESIPPATAPLGSPLVYVDKPTVAAYFDRTQMVTRTGAHRVSLHEFEIWSDPPSDLIARALVDDLAHRFGKDRVMITPVARYARPDWRVVLDVTRFDVEETGQAVLDVRWTLLREPDDRLAVMHRNRIETPVGDVANPTERAGALRAAVAMLAGDIGDAIASAGRP
jgi:uncharacterized lipoprotein YmbA